MTFYIKLLRDFGFPVAVASLLIWLIVSGMPQQVRTNSDKLVTIVSAVSAHQADQEDLKKIMQQICVNTSLDNQSRRGCFP